MTAVVLALASAWAFAVATVVGHRAATNTAVAERENRGSRSVLLVVRRLLQQPGFLVGQLAGALGLVLHAAALSAGLLVVVQPLLCTGLVMALALGAVVDRRHPDRPLPHRRQWMAATLVVSGLFLFLVSAAPSAGAHPVSAPALLTAMATFAVVTGTVCVRVRRGRSRHPALLLGAATGMAFGLSGVLVKAVTTLPVASWPTAWPVYALAAVGLTGTALAQWAYGAGPLVQSQPAQSALEPVVALGMAGPVLGEALAGGALAHTGQVLGVGLMLAGVVGVARHAATAPGHAVPLRDQVL